MNTASPQTAAERLAREAWKDRSSKPSTISPGNWSQPGPPIALLRFADLQERGIVNSWPQLKRLQDLHGFPLGRMLSPNIRAWDAAEIDKWFSSRPVENDRPL